MERSTIFDGKIHYFYGNFQLLFVSLPEGIYQNQIPMIKLQDSDRYTAMTITMIQWESDSDRYDRNIPDSMLWPCHIYLFEAVSCVLDMLFTVKNFG